MKSIIVGYFLAISLIVWHEGHAQLPQVASKQLDELLATHEPVSVTSDADGVYITFVKGAEVYRSTITPYVDPGNPSAWKPGYNIYCYSMGKSVSPMNIP